MRVANDGRERGSPLAAGFSYFAIVFAFGLPLGALRAFLVHVHVDPIEAVLIVLSAMLAVSWIVARRVATRRRIPAEFEARAAMGGFAFLFLMAAEAAVSVFVLDMPIEDHWARYETPAGLPGLLGQIAFGLIPVIQGRRRPIEY